MIKVYALIFIYLISYTTVVEPVVIQKHRSKRLLSAIAAIVTIIAGIAGTAASGVSIYYTIRGDMVKKSCGVRISMTQVNNYYNYNMGNSMELKNKVTRKSHEAGDAIKVSSNGFTCNASFCNQLGPNVRGTLGICNRNFCGCSGGVATLYTCQQGQVFCPMKNRCVIPNQAVLCH